eukprot:gnl/MRDRNA2_/MRDRNA2_322115_c0_seq1.p1 gnl/MRDRNA2_/MRDRNA2_322115_c0~~gnl/MRDRNA2_/MRDRNA2_322115_c0_seq1.p1  ORF type:complete len:126 (-),score=18.84 gnl/MRDRNA2_/MRDRNA2_322115_c0_seq1:183-536(-)
MSAAEVHQVVLAGQYKVCTGTQILARNGLQDEQMECKEESVGETGEAMECAICLDVLMNGDTASQLVQLRCGHVFHEACIVRALRSHCCCPYCRQDARRQLSAPQAALLFRPESRIN